MTADCPPDQAWDLLGSKRCAHARWCQGFLLSLVGTEKLCPSRKLQSGPLLPMHRREATAVRRSESEQLGAFLR